MSAQVLSLAFRNFHSPMGSARGTLPFGLLEVFFSDRVVCPICNGCGKVNVPADAVLHDTCKGQGKIRMRGPMGKQNMECSDCRGTGWISPTRL
jgi:RecJ-like exonuclease